MSNKFQKAIAGKTTKLAGKSLKSDAVSISPVLSAYIEGSLYNLPLDSIAPDPTQPRKYFDEDKLNELAESIKSKGVLQPIIVRKNPSEESGSEFLIIAGERRFRASKLAGLDLIPAIFTEGDPEEIALIENLQRDDLKPLEEAEGYKRIMESHGYTQEQLSAVVGKTRSTIAEVLTLNRLPENIKEDCLNTDVSKTALLEIAKRKDPEEALFLYNKVKNENFTVARIKQLTRPKPERKRLSPQSSVLQKIAETRKLVLKIKIEELEKEEKAKIWEEFNELYRVINNSINNS